VTRPAADLEKQSPAPGARAESGADPPAAVPRWHGHGLNRVGYYRLAAGAARLLPRPLALRAACRVGRLLGRRLAGERRAVAANLQRVLGIGPSRRLDEAVDETFVRFAACFADLLTLNRRPPERLERALASADGEEQLHRALAGNRGVIVLTAHLGNWDLAGRLMAHRHGRPTHVVLSAEQDAALERYLRTGTPGLTFVTRRAATSTLPVWAALRRNEVVAMQVDRATGGRADAIAPFFGAPAAFPVGPFVLARASGAPVVPVFCHMTDDGRYRITVEQALRVKPGEEPAALRAVVEALERAVARHPTQWFNFYDVWGDSGGRA
jgi:lauroyl/myristoyl acyltransferase